MKCRSVYMRELPPEQWCHADDDIGKHFYNPAVTSMARSMLYAMENDSQEQIRTFSRGLLAIISTY